MHTYVTYSIKKHYLTQKVTMQIKKNEITSRNFRRRAENRTENLTQLSREKTALTAKKAGTAAITAK